MMAQMPFGVLFPIIAGVAFDRTGSYREIFMIYGFVVMCSALCVLAVRRPPWEQVASADHVGGRALEPEQATA